jgi:deazaflavin-dependent oxidoreductase (nitroreductase family)
MSTAPPRPRSRQLSRWERLLEGFAKSKVGGAYFVHVGQRIDPPLLKLSRGRFHTAVGYPAALLIHQGAKSGVRRETPLLYIADGDDVVLVASKAGAAKHPAWYHNLRANPECEIFAKDRTGTYVAREAEGEERERLWAIVNDLYAGYDTYQGRAGARRIPVMVLSPAVDA